MRGIQVPFALLAVGVLLWADPWRFASPVAPAADVPARAVVITTVRRPLLRPEIRLAGFTYRCSECHNLFPSPPETTRSLTQHGNVTLKHGINTRCFNCHHLTNRDAFVDDWGREIPYDSPQLLCARCHGPVYRDWVHGAHGRTNGYWDARRGKQVRKKCIECHDPHRPPFPPMVPAPAPNTLRMGDQQLPAEHPKRLDPLRIYHGSTATRRGDAAPRQQARSDNETGGNRQ